MRDMGFDVTKEQVQNHDKLISRRLKNIMSNVGPKSSGRGRISFLNETKVLEVYGKRPNINPEYVSESSVGEVTHANRLQRLENLSNKENEGNSSSPSVQESPKSSRRESKTSLSIAALKESMDEQNLAMKERNRHLAKIANDNEKWVAENISIKKERNELLKQQLLLMQTLITTLENQNETGTLKINTYDQQGLPEKKKKGHE
ncbi:unnamed protein product [Callosobruchus maculatus]|uniref:Uncharacterized protein n=1 Tax=Callosobruchus maculatus TaxID=64391 RepID=A0A653DZ41_CALMS|nr:unnamed protein product [Callosobruchus maculatus]